MKRLKVVVGSVEGGRLVVNEPSDLPDGTQVFLEAVVWTDPQRRMLAGADQVTIVDGKEWKPTHYIPVEAFTPEEWVMIAKDEVDPVDVDAALAWMRGEGPDPWLDPPTPVK